MNALAKMETVLKYVPTPLEVITAHAQLAMC